VHILDLIDSMESLLLRDKRFEAAAHFVDFWRGKGAFDFLDDVDQMQSMQSLSKTILDFQALLSERIGLEEYRNIEAPCCLIGGLQSQPAAQQVLARLSSIPSMGRNMLWLIAGHMAPIIQPDLVEPRIMDFIARIDAADDASTSPPAVIATAKSVETNQVSSALNSEALSSELNRIPTKQARRDLWLFPLSPTQT
jgi:hypothetical protein